MKTPVLINSFCSIKKNPRDKKNAGGKSSELVSFDVSSDSVDNC